MRWPNSAESLASRSQWPSVYGSLPSMLRAKAKSTASARSNSSVYRLILTRVRTRARSSLGSTGLLRKSSAPASRPRMRSWVAAREVTSTIGVSRDSGLFFSCRQTSKPSRPGIFTSSRTKSGASLLTANCCKASWPFGTVTTLYPRVESISAINVRHMGSSSTTRTMLLVGSWLSNDWTLQELSG